MAVLSPQPKMQFTTAAGVPLSGGKVYTYIAGTTTPQVTFTDSSGATPNTNPVILDSRGEANIWLGGALYKFRLTDANDVEIWTVDYISAPTSAVSPVLSGSVTIDSDTPGPALRITQTGTGPVLRVQDSADPDTTPFIIDTAGNLGLGTATPTAQMEVTGAAKIGSLTLTSSPLPVDSGGTGAATAAGARANLGVPASGPVTASGLTMATSRLLGRTTAGSGAVEEIAVGSGLLLSSGTLAVNLSALQFQEQLFTSSGTWTAPTGVTRAQVVVIGGGGGGGSSTSVGCGTPGGVGGYGGVAVGLVTVVPGTSYTITVGTGGTGGAADANVNGTTGGTSSFGALMSATGGGGGVRAFGGAAPGAPGAGSGGTTRNTNIGVATASPFDGTLSFAGGSEIQRTRSGGFTTTPVAWSASSASAAGARGGSTEGGVGGVVYIQWVG